MRNRFPGRCNDCGEDVEAEAGYFQKNPKPRGPKWLVRCVECVARGKVERGKPLTPPQEAALRPKPAEDDGPPKFAISAAVRALAEASGRYSRWQTDGAHPLYVPQTLYDALAEAGTDMADIAVQPAIPVIVRRRSPKEPGVWLPAQTLQSHGR